MYNTFLSALYTNQLGWSYGLAYFLGIGLTFIAPPYLVVDFFYFFENYN